MNRGFPSFVKGQKPIFPLCYLKFIKNNLAQGVPCEPEALIVPALGGLVYFMGNFEEIPIKICVGALYNQQWLFQLRSSTSFYKILLVIFFRVVTTAAEQPNIKHWSQSSYIPFNLHFQYYIKYWWVGCIQNNTKYNNTPRNARYWKYSNNAYYMN